MWAAAFPPTPSASAGAATLDDTEFAQPEASPLCEMPVRGRRSVSPKDQLRCRRAGRTIVRTRFSKVSHEGKF